MGFNYRENMLGEHGRVLKKVVLDATDDFRVGDAVAAGTGGEGFVGEAILATAGIKILGIVQAIITKEGVAPSSNGCGGAFVSTYYTAASNETGAQVSAIIDCSPFSVFSVGADDTLGTTTGSNKPWYMMDVKAGADTGVSGQLDESTVAVGTPTGSGQFISHGLDPQDTTRVLVSIHETLFISDSGI